MWVKLGRRWTLQPHVCQGRAGGWKWIFRCLANIIDRNLRTIRISSGTSLRDLERSKELHCSAPGLWKQCRSLECTEPLNSTRKANFHLCSWDLVVSVKARALKWTCEAGDCCCVRIWPTWLPRTVAVYQTRNRRNNHLFSYCETRDDPEIEWSLGRVKINLEVTL